MPTILLALALYVAGVSGRDIASYVLRNGRSMPRLGLRAPPELLRWALQAEPGSAWQLAMVETEHRAVGEGLREAKRPRGEFFVSSSLRSHGFEEAHRNMRSLLRQLRLDYVDLLVMASPWEGKLIETWDAMVEMKKMGLVRSLGIRDFDIHHLETFTSHGRDLPEVLQLELHPFNLQERQELLQWCKERHIQIQATGSLSGLQEATQSLESISKTKQKSPAQILLRWALQMEFQVMPRSEKKEHIEENFQVFDFELTLEEMTFISELEGKIGWHALNAPLHLGDTTRQNRSEAIQPGLSAELWCSKLAITSKNLLWTYQFLREKSGFKRTCCGNRIRASIDAIDPLGTDQRMHSYQGIKPEFVWTILKVRLGDTNLIAEVEKECESVWESADIAWDLSNIFRFWSNLTPFDLTSWTRIRSIEHISTKSRWLIPMLSRVCPGLYSLRRGVQVWRQICVFSLDMH